MKKLIIILCLCLFSVSIQAKTYSIVEFGREWYSNNVLFNKKWQDGTPITIRGKILFIHQEENSELQQELGAKYTLLAGEGDGRNNNYYYGVIFYLKDDKYIYSIKIGDTITVNGIYRTTATLDGFNDGILFVVEIVSIQ